MPEPTVLDRLAAIATTIRERTFSGVAATAGLARPLTDDEKAAVKRAWAIRDMKARQRKAAGPITSAERKHARNNMNSAVPRGTECADWKRRRRLERDPAAWLRYYLAETYSRPFDKPHREIIAGAMHAHETGGRFVVAAERGVGKSAVLYGLVLYLALTGRRRFPVYLPWAANVMRRGLQFWRAALSFNERILADYRWHAAPFAVMRGYSNRLRAAWWQEHDGDQTGPPTNAALKISDGMIVLPDARGVIGGATINGNPRGLNLPQPDGTVLRPDLALVDDPQDRKVARSPVLVSETCAKIDGDVAGLGTAGAPFPLLMSGNCVLAGDVMERYIADTNWRALRISCVEAWPDGWADKGPAYQLWSDWWDAYQTDAKAGATYYRANRKAMIAGMRLSAPNAYKAQRSAVLPDEFAVAMRQYWQMGHAAFMAERQQSPVAADISSLTITPAIIVSRTTDRKPHEIPQAWDKGAAVTAWATDINHYGLTYAEAAFNRDQSAAVLTYGVDDRIVVPENCTPSQIPPLVVGMLANHARAIAAMPVVPQVWFIDGGYCHEAVQQFVRQNPAARIPGCQTYVARGFGENYRPTKANIAGKTVIDGGEIRAHLAKWPMGHGVAWSSHYWHEVAQRAWGGEIGAPGAVSLPNGDHREFAQQVCADVLLEVLEGKWGKVWRWKQIGRNDYGDCMAMLYVAAAWGGIGTGGVVAANPKKSARAIVVRPSQRR